MKDLNRCDFIGRLGKDPEVKYAGNGNAICNISIACGNSWKDKSTGEKRQSTDWIPVCIFGKLAEIAGEHLCKGAKVYVSGEFKTRKWQDKTGADRYTTEVVISGFNGILQMLDKPNDTTLTKPPVEAHITPVADDFDDDIPF